MALRAVVEVAKRAVVRASAIVRFVCALAYSFTEMQQVFRLCLVASPALSYKGRGSNEPQAMLGRPHRKP